MFENHKVKRKIKKIKEDALLYSNNFDAVTNEVNVLNLETILIAYVCYLYSNRSKEELLKLFYNTVTESYEKRLRFVEDDQVEDFKIQIKMAFNSFKGINKYLNENKVDNKNDVLLSMKTDVILRFLNLRDTNNNRFLVKSLLNEYDEDEK